jgi:CubicO group peptidase (beta-lactamase class C family)
MPLHCSRRSVLRAGLAASLGASAASAPQVARAETKAGAPSLTEADGFRIHPFQTSVMQGSPPAAKDVVTLDNRLTDRAKHQWALRHAREMLPTQPIPRGGGPPMAWPRKPMPVPRFNEQPLTMPDGAQTTVGAYLKVQSTDALLVVHQGAIVTEQYFHLMTPSTPHELFSAGKSLVGTLVGALLGNELSETAAIDSYLPELAGTAYAGVTLRELLDMKSGLDFSYGFNPDSEATRLNDLSRGTLKDTPAAGHIEFLKSIKRIQKAGQRFRYKESDVVAATFAAERRTGQRFADLFGERIWSRLGPEHEAYVRCDGLGGAIPSMGISATARDLALWGQLCLNDGAWQGHQLIPKAFFGDLRRRRTQQIDVGNWVSGVPDLRMPQGTAYGSFFWFPPGKSTAVLASGAFGQTCYINWTFNTVVLFFSSWIVGDDWTKLTADQWHACEQISQLVSGRGG